MSVVESDLDFALAVALAEDSEGLSDDDFKSEDASLNQRSLLRRFQKSCSSKRTQIRKVSKVGGKQSKCNGADHRQASGKRNNKPATVKRNVAGRELPPLSAVFSCDSREIRGDFIQISPEKRRLFTLDFVSREEEHPHIPTGVEQDIEGIDGFSIDGLDSADRELDDVYCESELDALMELCSRAIHDERDTSSSSIIGDHCAVVSETEKRPDSPVSIDESEIVISLDDAAGSGYFAGVIVSSIVAETQPALITHSSLSSGPDDAFSERTNEGEDMNNYSEELLYGGKDNVIGSTSEAEMSEAGNFDEDVSFLMTQNPLWNRQDGSVFCGNSVLPVKYSGHVVSKNDPPIKLNSLVVDEPRLIQTSMECSPTKGDDPEVSAEEVQSPLFSPKQKMKVSQSAFLSIVKFIGSQPIQPHDQFRLLRPTFEELPLSNIDFEQHQIHGGIQESLGTAHPEKGSQQEGFPSASLKCPICDGDISAISVEQREGHTNACLDKLDGAQSEAFPDDKRLGEHDRIIQWLGTLNLSKYADLFIEQEVDWDTLQWLTEEDLLMMGINALGPRRKIVCALKELKNNASSANTIVGTSGNFKEKATRADNIPGSYSNAGVSNSVQESATGESLITSFFPLVADASARSKPSACRVPKQTSEKHRADHPPTVQKRPRSSFRCTTASQVPQWKCIRGTNFRVDAFQHLSGDCTCWFLTHFHTDHYQGLTRSFRHGQIYCTQITARLVNLRIGIPWDKLRVLPLNERVNVAGVNVTFIDANHCPGSVMILFEPENSESVLHTGDFRFCSEMTDSCVLQAASIHTLILDTTYCDPQSRCAMNDSSEQEGDLTDRIRKYLETPTQYDFPKQEAVIQFVIEAIQAEAFNPSTLFLIGTYTIGKERIFLEVARALQKKVYLGVAKMKLLECMSLSEEYRRWLTCNDQESFIHVVPLWSISSFKRMNSISRLYRGKYDLIVGFSPTGWSFGRGKKRTDGRRSQQGTMIRYEVPYSEHCSFSELKDFVKFIAPEDIVPSVRSSTGVGMDEMIAKLWNDEE